VKQFLAFPMLLSVLWLLWVLGQQAAFDVIILIIASLIFLLFAFWLKGRVARGPKRMIAMLIAIALVLYPLYSIYEKNMLHHRQAMRTQAFSKERLQNLIADKQKVFVYATAAWCITCKVNERLAMDTTAVKAFFKNEKIHALKADWTNQYDTILEYLQSFGRAGVPLYVYYSPGEPPKVLPQLLTPSIIIESIKGENP